MTRTGVLPYEDAQGNRWRELRPAEEVFSTDSLATLRDAPVTVLHPSGLVTRETWDDVAVGHNGGGACVESDRLVVTDGLVVQSADAVARVRSGELCETSAGYTCDLDESPGVDPVDGAYDKIQRNIRYNHIALGPAGWARGGREMALRMDGVATDVTDVAPVAPAQLSADPALPRNDSAGSPAKDNRMKLKIKGREYRADAADEMVEAQKKVDEMEGAETEHAAANASISAELAATKAAMISIAQKLSALEVKIAAEEAAESGAKPDAISEDDVPEAVQDSIIAKRGTLLATAKAVLPADVKLDGLKASEIKRKVAAHAHPTVKLDGLGPDTIEGLYLGATAAHAAQSQKRTDGNSALANVLLPSGDQGDAVKREDGAAARPASNLQKKLIDQGAQPLNAKVS